MAVTGVPTQLGDYQILQLIHETEDTQTFEARQLSVGRTVALAILRPHRSGDPEAVEAFRAEIRAKAAVNHPRIASVYEAREDSGVLYYTREVVEGRDVAQMLAEGREVPLGAVLDLVRAASETGLYYESQGIHYRALTPESLVLAQGEPYVANLATRTPEGDAFRGSLETLRSSLPELLDPSEARHPDVANFFARMDPSHERAYRNWHELQRACNIARRVITRPLVSRTPTAPLGRPAKHSSMGIGWALVAVIALAGLGGLAYALWFSAPKVRALDEMVLIPAGELTSADGKRKPVPAFHISRHEVTISEYAEFLDALAKGASPTRHPHQPQNKTSHVPPTWAAYYPLAKKGGVYLGNRIDLNCPVMDVDWWDAQAYAQWKGRRLPASEEWERAARGTESFLFPWGNEFDPKRLNSGLDANDNPRQGGAVDGYNAWSPVDAIAGDRSPFGIVGMAGNLSEWTNSLGPDPNDPDKQIPILRGGSFRSDSGLELTTIKSRDFNSAAPFVGFRTASDVR